MGDETRTMDIWGHIGELRRRLFLGLLALIEATLGSFLFADKLIELLARPIGGTQALQAIEVTENISVFMRVSLLSGFIIAFPFILFEIFQFIKPGLTSKERRWVYFTIPFATLLFISGVTFTYLVMLPAGLPVLLNWMNIRTVPRPDSYFNFVTGLLFWVGISFEAPLMVFLLAKLQFVSARGLIKQWRIALLVIAVAAAVITPTGDPVNMGLLMLPLFILYLLSILFAFIARRGEAKNELRYNQS